MPALPVSCSAAPAGFATPVDLETVAAGTGGFAIQGENAYDSAGHSVSAAGGVNRDGNAAFSAAGQLRYAVSWADKIIRRGGPVCMDSLAGGDRWVPAGFRLPRDAGAG